MLRLNSAQLNWGRERDTASCCLRLLKPFSNQPKVLPLGYCFCLATAAAVPCPPPINLTTWLGQCKNARLEAIPSGAEQSRPDSSRLCRVVTMTPTSTAGQQQQQQQWQQQQVAQDRNVFCYLLFVVVQRHSSHVSAMSVWGVSSVVIVRLVRACGQAKIHYTESIFISSAECRHYGSTSSTNSSGSSSQLVWHLNVARGLFDFCFNHWASHLPMWLSSCPCVPSHSLSPACFN